MKEYAIWGVPPGASDETLLISHPGGKPIETREEAVKFKNLLFSRHGCTKLRIQEIDLGKEFNFAEEAL